MDVQSILNRYGPDITIAVLGGHSALDVCQGAKQLGFRTLAICMAGREKTYAHYYKTRGDKGCVDEVMVLDHFKDITQPEVVKRLQEKHAVIVHNRYFWVYCDFNEIERNFKVPIVGSREMLKLEERDVEKNQYYLLQQAGIRMPNLFSSPQEIDRLVIVKTNEALRGYERAFFFASSPEQYQEKAKELVDAGTITAESLQKAVIEEYVVGAQVNLNFFYSPLTEELELMGTDMRRQTNLDGLLRLPANTQLEVLKYVKPKLIETGHVAVTMKESLVEKAFLIGEQFVRTTKKECSPGIIGAFALQGAVAAREGKEEFVIFDVSMRIPGSPGTAATPYALYKYHEPMSYGKRIALEIKCALDEKKLGVICT